MKELDIGQSAPGSLASLAPGSIYAAQFKIEVGAGKKSALPPGAMTPNVKVNPAGINADPAVPERWHPFGLHRQLQGSQGRYMNIDSKAPQMSRIWSSPGLCVPLPAPAPAVHDHGFSYGVSELLERGDEGLVDDEEAAAAFAARLVVGKIL